MSKILELDPRTKVQGDEKGAFRGRLGLLRYDTSIQGFVAITAAQIAGASDRLLTDGIVVATRSRNGFDDDRSETDRAADSMLWTLRIDEKHKLSQVQIIDADGAPVAWPGIVTDVEMLLGERVLIQKSAGEIHMGRLRSTSAYFRMPVPGIRKPVRFFDALEITSLTGEPVTIRGDAGAVVTTLAGDVIGTILCGIDDASYAAPLARYLGKLQDLQAASPDIIMAYNKEVGQASRAVPRGARGGRKIGNAQYAQACAAFDSGKPAEVARAVKLVKDLF